jgi:hypothetical protein
MTGVYMNEILHAVETHALSRFSSTYRLSFSPDSSDPPRRHTLEVKLVEKGRGTVSDGRRTVAY